MNKNPIIVTGANGGIGEAVTRKLISQEFFVVAISQNIDSLNEKFQDYDNCKTISFDLNKLDEIPNLIKGIVQEYGGIRGLVHCAGFDKLFPLYLTKMNDVRDLFSIHVFSAISLVSQLAKKGNSSEDCAIVLVSSLSAHEGAQGHSAYASAKGAIEGFIPTAASELAEKGIRLNAVVPGVVYTKMSAGFIDRLDEAQRAALNKSYPLGIGEPSDVANLICFLLSNESKWITGQSYIIDGGHMCRKA